MCSNSLDKRANAITGYSCHVSHACSPSLRTYSYAPKVTERLSTHEANPACEDHLTPPAVIGPMKSTHTQQCIRATNRRTSFRARRGPPPKIAVRVKPYRSIRTSPRLMRRDQELLAGGAPVVS